MSNNNSNLSPTSLLEVLVNRASSVAEVTECLKAATAYTNACTQEQQLRQDQNRQGYLLNEIMRLYTQLDIPRYEQRNLKSMTTPQLQAHADELYCQSRNRSVSHLSVA